MNFNSENLTSQENIHFDFAGYVLGNGVWLPPRIMNTNTNWNLVLIKRKLNFANTIKGLLKGETNAIQQKS